MLQLRAFILQCAATTEKLHPLRSIQVKVGSGQLVAAASFPLETRWKCSPLMLQDKISAGSKMLQLCDIEC